MQPRSSGAGKALQAKAAKLPELSSLFSLGLTDLSSLFQCVKVAIKDKQVKYFIHYSGWNKK